MTGFLEEYSRDFDRIIFDVFNDADLYIYEDLFGNSGSEDGKW